MCHKSLPLSTCLAVGFPYGKCLTEEQEILSRWTDYCSEQEIREVKVFHLYEYISRFSFGYSSRTRTGSESNLPILTRWTEYCLELYNHESCGDNAELDCSQPPKEDLQPILREEVKIAVESLKQR